MTLTFFNTLGRELREFRPIRPEEVSLYTCGPTVWNYAHIGNLRTYLFEDILKRTLEFAGFRVKHVMNITDVGHLTDDADQGEDKMLKGAREKGRTVWDIADLYTKAFFEDLGLLNIEPPAIACRATDHIEDMIRLIQRLEGRGFTYAKGGNIYFDIGRLPDYGKLARLNLEDLKAGARIAIDENKKNPHDFVLWFTRSKFEHQAMLWDSPWGRGYPGWHIECSAMSMKYLGEQFDIHCGGVDHVSVHHTNEIAQSESATGRKWVNYWLHGEYLVLAKEKMAKSAGNFLTLSRLQELGYHPLDYRYFCLGAHYRTQLQFSFEALDAARSARAKLEERLRSLKDRLRVISSPPAVVNGKAKAYLDSFSRHLADDLNAPRGLSDLWGLVKDEEVESSFKLRVILAMDRILGLNLKQVRRQDIELDEEIKGLIDRREEARRRRDFTEADTIRDRLRTMGIILEDTPAGVRWKIKK